MLLRNICIECDVVLCLGVIGIVVFCFYCEFMMFFMVFVMFDVVFFLFGDLVVICCECVVVELCVGCLVVIDDSYG